MYTEPEGNGLSPLHMPKAYLQISSPLGRRGRCHSGKGPFLFPISSFFHGKGEVCVQITPLFSGSGSWLSEVILRICQGSSHRGSQEAAPFPSDQKSRDCCLCSPTLIWVCVLAKLTWKGGCSGLPHH